VLNARPADTSGFSKIPTAMRNISIKENLSVKLFGLIGDFMEKNQNIISMKQAAKISKCTVAAIFSAIKSKRLKASREGLRWWILKEDLQAYKKNRYSRAYSKYQGMPLFDKSKGEHSVPETAKLLGSTLPLTYYWVRANRIPSKRKGLSYVIQIEDIISFKNDLQKSKKLPLRVI
jgi:hypothetical protein